MAYRIMRTSITSSTLVGTQIEEINKSPDLAGAQVFIDSLKDGLIRSGYKLINHSPRVLVMVSPSNIRYEYRIERLDK